MKNDMHLKEMRFGIAALQCKAYKVAIASPSSSFIGKVFQRKERPKEGMKKEKTDQM